MLHSKKTLEKIGNRNTVFENKKAVSFYMPIEQDLTVIGNGHVSINLIERIAQNVGYARRAVLQMRLSALERRTLFKRL